MASRALKASDPQSPCPPTHRSQDRGHHGVTTASQRLQAHQVQRHSQLHVASGWEPLTGHTCPQRMGGAHHRPCWRQTRGVTSVSYPDRRREQGPQEAAASSQAADGDTEVAMGYAHVWPLGPTPEK